MFPYMDVFEDSLSRLKSEGCYRYFTTIERSAEHFPLGYYYKEGQKKTVTLWCSNDYLGQGCRKATCEAMSRAAKLYGTGSGGTRNISGNSFLHVKLEKALAAWHHKESALLFTSGYVANEATLTAIGGIIPHCVIFSDEKNHASIIQGIRQSKLKKHIFPHNDIKALEQLLKLYPLEQPKLIVFESVYSMDGSFGKIAEICALAKQYGALTYLDELHAIGMYGATGAGLAEALSLGQKIDIIQATLGKAIGCIGGYISGKAPFVDAIRSYASGFIFTTSLPPAISAAALESISFLASTEGEELRTRHQIVAHKVKSALKKEGFPLIENPSHIAPLLIGDSVVCQKLAELLLEKFQLYMQPINYPTVPKGLERLRITPTPFHSDAQIEDLILALKTSFSEIGIGLNKKQPKAKIIGYFEGCNAPMAST